MHFETLERRYVIVKLHCVVQIHEEERVGDWERYAIRDVVADWAAHTQIVSVLLRPREGEGVHRVRVYQADCRLIKSEQEKLFEIVVTYAVA